MRTGFCLFLLALCHTVAHAQSPRSTDEDAPATQLTPIQVRASAPEAALALQAPQQTGSRLNLTPLETPASISAMDSTGITQRGLSRAQDVAVRLPGIAQAPTPGNGGSALIARGFLGHNSVAQLIDGTRQVVALGSITYPFSTWPFESVQVLSGPASVVHGDGTIGAAVNYVSKQPVWDATLGEAFLSVGSWGLVQSGVGVRGPVNDVFAYAVHLDAERSDGYRALEDVKRHNYALALALKPNDRLQASVSLDGGHNDDARYFGTPLRDGVLDKHLKRINYNVGDAFIRHDDQMWRAKVQYTVNPTLSLHHETYRTRSDRHWRNAEATRLDTSTNTVTRYDYIDVLHAQTQTGHKLDATVNATLAGLPHRLVVGIEAYQAKFLHTSNSPYGGSSVLDPIVFDRGRFDSPDPLQRASARKLRAQTAFVESALDLTPQWKLVTGLRHTRMRLHDHNLRTDVQRSISYHPNTGRAGLVWMPNADLSVYTQYATATDPVSGSLALPGGRTDFDLTKGQQWETGVKGLLPAVQGEWTVAVYRIRKNNLLSRHPDNPALVQQIGEQTSTGVEFALAIKPHTDWTVEANIAALRAKYTDFHERVSGVAVSRVGNIPRGVPERMANLWTSWRFAPQWTLSGGLHYVGKRPTNTANSRWMPAYTLLDASAHYDWSSTLRFALHLKNLTNRTYALSGSDNQWLLGAPRSVLFTARATF